MATNSTINYTNTNLDLTTRVYDSFYGYEAAVPTAEYDIVFSYFKSVMENEFAAANFAASIFQIADITKIPALTLLDNLQGLSGLQLTANMAYYLNNIRSRATLLGVNASTVPNFYAARSVLQ
jgi:hypothetical protein